MAKPRNAQRLQRITEARAGQAQGTRAGAEMRESRKDRGPGAPGPLTFSNRHPSLLMLTRKKRSGCKSSVQENDVN